MNNNKNKRSKRMKPSDCLHSVVHHTQSQENDVLSVGLFFSRFWPIFSKIIFSFKLKIWHNVGVGNVF